MQTLTRAKGYSLIEVLGTLAVVLVLVAIAIPYYRNNNIAAKQEAANYNAKILNMSAEKYNLSGIRVTDPSDSNKRMVLNLTADVPRPSSVDGLPQSSLPETLAVGLLRSEFTDAITGTHAGPFIPAYLKPVFSSNPNDYRVVWVNGLTTSNPGRFETVGPTGQTPSALGLPNDVPGITALSKDGVDGSGNYTGSPIRKTGGTDGIDTTYGDPSTTITTGAVHTIHLALGSTAGGTVSPATASSSDSQIAYRADASPGYTFSHWDGALSGRPATGTLLPNDPAFPKTSDKSAKAYFTPTGSGTGTGLNNLEIQLDNPVGGTVTGAGEYNTNLTATAAATANTGYVFSGWTGDKNTSATSVSITPADFEASTTPGLITLIAHFTADPTAQEGAESTPAPNPTATPDTTATPSGTATPFGWTPTPVPSPVNGYDPITGYPVTPAPTPVPTPVSEYFNNLELAAQFAPPVNMSADAYPSAFSHTTEGSLWYSNLSYKPATDPYNPGDSIEMNAKLTTGTTAPGHAFITYVVPDTFQITNILNTPQNAPIGGGVDWILSGSGGGYRWYILEGNAIGANSIIWPRVGINVGPVGVHDIYVKVERASGIVDIDEHYTITVAPAPTPSPTPTPTPGPTPTPTPEVAQSGGTINLWGQGIMSHLGAETDLRIELYNDNTNPSLPITLNNMVAVIPDGFEILSYDANPVGQAGSQFTLVSANGNTLTWSGSLQGGEHLESIIHVKGITPGNYSATLDTASNAVDGTRHADRSLYVPQYYPLAMTIQTSSSQVNKDGNIQFIAEIQNNNTAPAPAMPNVSFLLPVPSGLAISNPSASVGTASVVGNTLQWSGTLPNGLLRITGTLTGVTGGTYNITGELTGPVNPSGSTTQTLSVQTVVDFYASNMTVTVGGTSPYYAGQQQTVTSQVNSGATAPGAVYMTTTFPDTIAFDGVVTGGNMTYLGTSTGGGYRWVVFSGTLGTYTQLQPTINITPSTAGNFTIISKTERVSGSEDISASTSFAPATPPNPFSSMTVAIGGTQPHVAGQQQTVTVQVNTNSFTPGNAYITVVMPDTISYDGIQEGGNLTFSSTSTSGGNRYVVFSGNLTANTQYQPVIRVTPTAGGNFTIEAKAERTLGTVDISGSVGFAPSGIVYSPFQAGFYGKGTPWTISGAGVTGTMDVQFQNQQAANVPFTVVVTPTNATMTNGNTVTGTAPSFTSTQLSSLLGFTSTGANPSFVIQIYRTGQASPDLTYNLNW